MSFVLKIFAVASEYQRKIASIEPIADPEVGPVVLSAVTSSCRTRGLNNDEEHRSCSAFLSLNPSYFVLC